jgi:hypothetical protein
MKTGLLLPLILFLTACTGIYEAVATYTAIDVASTVITGKTVDDRAVSYIKDQDCSIARWLEGRPYCLAPQPAAAPAEPASYCYPTLAGVDCFTDKIENQNDRLLNR